MLLWLMSCGVHAHAQEIIKLSKVTPLAVPEDIYIDSVMASFSDSARIGTVLRGLGNKPIPAFVAGGVAKGIHGVLKNPSSDDRVLHCTMRVNALDIREISTGTSEKATCALNFELLSLTDSGWVRLFDHAALSTVGGGLDATGKHAANIVDAFAQGFAEFTRLQQSGELPAPVLVDAPKAGIYGGENRAYPVLVVGAPARGSYRSFMAFRDQHPDTSVTFTMKPVGKDDPLREMYKLKTARDEAMPSEPWGVSDGKQLYLNMGKRYLRMNRSGNEFKANYGLGGSGQVDAAAISVGVGFGLLGVLVYYGASGTSAQQHVPVKLDMLTGDLVPVFDPRVGAPLKDETSDHLFQYSRICPMDTIVKILVYGGLKAELTKEGYHVLKLVPRPDTVPVEIQVGDGPPTSIEVSTARIGGEPSVYLIKVGKDAIPTVDRLGANMAGPLLQKLDPNKEVN